MVLVPVAGVSGIGTVDIVADHCSRRSTGFVGAGVEVRDYLATIDLVHSLPGLV